MLLYIIYKLDFINIRKLFFAPLSTCVLHEQSTMVSDNTSIKAPFFAGIAKMCKRCIQKEDETLCKLPDVKVQAKATWKVLGARKKHREAFGCAR